ncbi:hypothetical protein E2C01_101959 [Portunus trituberculatus]
MCIQ